MDEIVTLPRNNNAVRLAQQYNNTAFFTRLLHVLNMIDELRD
jgi:hypothetical protein